ncbi:M3 family metallopeptidase [Bacteroidota bacterium]
MKNTIMLIFISGIFLGSCQNQPGEKDSIDNPFFSDYGTPYEVPVFDKIKVAHYMPAFKKAIEMENAEIEAITSQNESPDFKNTILQLEYSGSFLTKVDEAYSNQRSVNTSPDFQETAKEIAPMLSKHRDNIILNDALFHRVKAVYEGKEAIDLTAEQEKLLEKQYKSFVRNGSNLDGEAKGKLRDINEQLSVLTLQFGDNLLGEDNKWKLVINNESDLAGLPDMLRASMAEAATETGFDGKWMVTLHKPSWIPFLQFSENRDLREKVYKAWMGRGNNENEFNNREIVAKIVSLRAEKAQLLGYKTWADYVLEETMAKTPDAVYDLMNNLWDRAIPIAKKEASDMQKMIDEEGGDFKLELWDWWFYAEKVRKARYDLDDELLRPYFELNTVREGLFYVVNKLFGLKFIELPDLPKPHPNAYAYEVQEADGTHVGIYYMDFHPRASKRGGAWMNSYRKQYKTIDGEFVKPVITNVFNFSKPAGDQPALLTFDEVETMFHEMGHALHGLLSDCTYRTLSGTSVPRDFVELPSQIMENWASEPEVLKVYAKHYETGEIISDELINKLNASSKFNQGFSMTEILAASLLDMEWHTLDGTFTGDVNAFEKERMDNINLIEEIIPRYRSTYFAHIFSGGYSSGYYSYTWAAVIDADAYQAFVETGDIFSAEKSMSFRENILSKGSTDDAMKLYKQFRGKEPEIDPLLERTGLM